MSELTVLADAESSADFDVAPEVFGVVEGPDGVCYFTDVSNHRIFSVDEEGRTSVVVGTGAAGNEGDGGPASQATTRQPYELRFDAVANLFFVDMEANVVRKVDRSTGLIETIAGSGREGFDGDGGPANEAALAKPHSIEIDDTTLYIADIANHRIRAVALGTGRIDTYAGTGGQEPIDPDRPIFDNAVNGPRAIAFDRSGNMILGLREGNAIYRIERTSGRIRHLAGSGRFGYSGDGGDARRARLAGPKGVALTSTGEIVLADTESHTIRAIGLDGTIRTLAGNGEPGEATDPTGACLNRPHGVFVTKTGSVLIGDSDNRRLLMLQL